MMAAKTTRKNSKSSKVKFEDIVDVISSTKKELSKLNNKSRKETKKPIKRSQAEIDDIVVNNYPLVAFIAKRFYVQNGEPIEDLIQVGSIGLIKAAKKFDASLNIKFSTFAVPIIEGEIRHYLRDKANTVRIPRKYMETNTKIKKFKQEYIADKGEEPTCDIIAKKLQLSRQLVEETITNINSMYTVPLEYNNIVDKKNREVLSHIENIVGERSVTENILEREGIREALNMLPRRERDIIYDHFFRDLGQKELAVIYNTSQAYISRLIKKSCEVLKEVM